MVMTMIIVIIESIIVVIINIESLSLLPLLQADRCMQVELKATSLYLIGECNPDTYPLQKKKHSLEYLRSIAHLRPRSNTLGAVTRVRSALAFATHQFFREAGFQYIHTPILSGADAEGAGEMFQVGSIIVLTCTCRLAWAETECPYVRYPKLNCLIGSPNGCLSLT